jgi:uncharacterized SAM-binding protein YcdF (DUF218 family)
MRSDRSPPSHPPAADAPDAVLVLGAATMAPGVPGPALRRRIEHGVSVFFIRGASHLIVSGGVVGPPPAEAEVMRQMAVALGVDAARIVVENEARNTFENAVYAGRIIRDRGWRRVVLVTDAFHLPRAAFVFARLGIAVESCGVPRQPGVSRAAWLRSHLGERIRVLRSAALFAIGAHKPLVERVWRR